MLNWDILPGMIKCGRVRCIGHGDHLDGEDCRMWTVIEVDGQKVLVLEQWRKGECERVEVSSDANFSLDEMVALSEAVGDLDRGSSPKIDQPDEMTYYHSW